MLIDVQVVNRLAPTGDWLQPNLPIKWGRALKQVRERAETPFGHDVECISGYKPCEEIKTPRLGNSDDRRLRVRYGLRNQEFFARNSA